MTAVTLLLDLDRVLLFALLLARAAGLVAAAPVLGDRAVPFRVRLFVAGVLALVLLPLVPTVPGGPAGPAGLALAAAGELSVGLALGFAARLVVLAFGMAGQIVGIQAGPGVAHLFDPGRPAANPIGRFLWIVGLTFFLGLGGHHHVLRALAGSLQIVPPGQAFVSAGTVEAIARLTGESLVLALRIAAPAMAVLLLVTLGLGLLSRGLPAMNVLLVGVPLHVAAGIAAIMLSLPFVLELARHEIGNLVNRLSSLVAAA